MNPEDLMRKYKYGYMFSKDLLESQFVKDLLKENKKQKEVIDRIDKYIKLLITNRDDEQCYAINWYNKDVLLDILKEVS